MSKHAYNLMVADRITEVKALANTTSVQAQIAYEAKCAHPDDLDTVAWADATRDIANDVYDEFFEGGSLREFVGVFVD